MQRAEFLSNELKRIDGACPTQGIEKHRKMATSPFVFFRGSSQLFYADLAAKSLDIPTPLLSLPLTTVMGDCHTANFGFFTEEGSHGDQVIFAVNDFDDACIGHAAWDLLRFSTSLLLAVDHCQGVVKGHYPSKGNHGGKVVASVSQAREAIAAFLRGYLSVCQMGMDGASHLAVTLQHFDSPAVLKKGYAKACQRAAGGELFNSKSALAKAVSVGEVPLKFNTLPDKFMPLSAELYQELEFVFAPYMDDSVLDIVERVNAGTGSVNMQRYYFLVGPSDYQGSQDLALYHLVEVKQQREAAPLHFNQALHPTNRLSPAHLTVMCQSRMQRRPDLVLDEALWNGNHWLIRSRHHAKVGIDPEDIGIGKKNANEGGLVDYAIACGKSLALAHCRGDRRSVRFEAQVCELLPRCISQIEDIAQAYAEQVKQDCRWLASLY